MILGTVGGLALVIFILLHEHVLLRSHAPGESAFRGGGPKTSLAWLEDAPLEDLEQALRLNPGELTGLLDMADGDEGGVNSSHRGRLGDMYEDDARAWHSSSLKDTLMPELLSVYPNCASLYAQNKSLVTVFTTMHPSKDPIKILAQRNTIQAYKNLAPLVHGIVFTRDRYWQAEARKLGIEVIENNKLNPYGTPLLRDMYLKTFARTKSYFAAYANADILFGEGFVKSLCAVEEAVKRGMIMKRVFLTGQRLNYALKAGDMISRNSQIIKKSLPSGRAARKLNFFKSTPKTFSS